MGTTPFVKEKESAVESFRCKLISSIRTGPTSFNGINISISKETNYTIDQTDKMDRLDEDNAKKQFTNHRPLPQSVGLNSKSDICAPIQLKAPATSRQHRWSSKVTQNVHQIPKVNKDPRPNIRPTATAFFQNSPPHRLLNCKCHGMKSSLRYFVILVDTEERCNTFHFSSNKCQQISISVMAAEI